MWHAKKTNKCIKFIYFVICLINLFFFSNFKLNLKVFDRFLGCFPIFMKGRKINLLVTYWLVLTDYVCF